MISFTPETGFSIEKLAALLVQTMRELDMDAQINLPNNVTIEVDKECTAKEIIDGYKEFLAKKIRATVASNKNEKKPGK